MKEIDVTNEYLNQAAPGTGAITYDKGLKPGRHKDETATAELLHTIFGGNIHIFNEQGYDTVSPDYQWKGKLWELKRPSTVTATDNAVKKALKQIYDNPGGIVLDYGEHTITDTISTVIRRRIERSNLPIIDVIFLKNNQLVKILRYKNEGR